MKKLLLLALVAGCLSCKKSNQATLHGTIENIDAKKVFLITIDQDRRRDSIIEIPVVNNKFTYLTEIEHPEAYHLFVNENLGPLVPVFIEPGISSIQISGKELSKNATQTGGKLIEAFNKSHQILYKNYISEGERLSKIQDSLITVDNYYSPQMVAIINQLRETDDFGLKNKLYKEMGLLEQNDQDVTDEGIKVKTALKNLRTQFNNNLYDYIDNESSLVAYYYLLKELKYRPENFKNIYNQERIKRFAALYPEHKYTNLANSWLNAAIDVQIGKQFVDFTAQSLTGEDIKFSEELNGKYVLLDLWATWCGPCIAKTQEMLPVYEKYKDTNLKIIGVAGEYKSDEKLMTFLKNNNWPWQQLVDLDHKNKIWEKYGIDGSGGALFLIDPEGKIAAINPEPQDLIQLLNNNATESLN